MIVFIYYELFISVTPPTTPAGPLGKYVDILNKIDIKSSNLILKIKMMV